MQGKVSKIEPIQDICCNKIRKISNGICPREILDYILQKNRKMGF